MLTMSRNGSDLMFSVSWDDADPNRVIGHPIIVESARVRDNVDVNRYLGMMGFELVSRFSDNVDRGWAIVRRAGETARRTYNPLSGQWQVYLIQGERDEIRRRYPGSQVPGVENEISRVPAYAKPITRAAEVALLQEQVS